MNLDMEVIVCERESSSYDQPHEKVLYEGHTGDAGPACIRVLSESSQSYGGCLAYIPFRLLERVVESSDMGFDDSLHKIIDRCEENHLQVWTYSHEDSITMRLPNLCLDRDDYFGGVAHVLELLSIESFLFLRGVNPENLY